MKVLLINGSPHKQGCTYTALNECAQTFLQRGIDVEWFWTGTQPVRGCTSCMACRKNEGHCAFDDADDIVNRLIEKLDECDGVIIGSPVYYAGINGQLKSILDRAFYAGFANVANKPAAAVASARRAGTTLTIDQMNKFFQICQMPVVSSTYWPMIHGTCAQEAQQDKEGLQTMRNLASQMAWMMQCFEVGDAAGFERPASVRVEKTSFIR